MRRSLLAGIIILGLLAGCVPSTPAAGDLQTPVAAATTAAAQPEAATPSAGSQELTKVTLLMGFIPNVQFAPLYVAQERGYFADAGLEVEFQYGAESDLLKLLGVNQAQFLIASGEEAVLGRSRDLPVRYVMRWYRQFPVVLFAKAESGIKQPADLAGKRVGISMLSGASYVAWEALVYATGIDPAKVSLEVIGFTQGAAISEGRVDAALDYVASGPTQLRLAGQDLTVIPVTDYIDLPSNGLITNDQMIAEQPEVVQGMVTAMMRGVQDTLDDPDAAFEISLKVVPEAGGEQKPVTRAIFDESVRLWQVEEGGTLGQSDPAAWAKAAEFMYKMGLVDRLIDQADLYTNQFVSGK